MDVLSKRGREERGRILTRIKEALIKGLMMTITIKTAPSSLWEHLDKVLREAMPGRGLHRSEDRGQDSWDGGGNMCIAVICRTAQWKLQPNHPLGLWTQM